jgi:tRNA pseudouridine32 synthase / 23S rRNA pseudouridine746 synthase
MIVAHTPDAAARISALFQQREVTKHYLVEVMGQPGELAAKGTISEPLDGKPALTSFTVRAVNPDRQTSVVMVRIDSGRKHQIRRHFEMIGCPVMGDPRYGKGNQDAGGLKLSAYALAFVCPFKGRPISVRLDVSDIHWAISPAVLLY